MVQLIFAWFTGMHWVPFLIEQSWISCWSCGEKFLLPKKSETPAARRSMQPVPHSIAAFEWGAGGGECQDKNLTLGNKAAEESVYNDVSAQLQKKLEQLVRRSRDSRRRHHQTLISRERAHAPNIHFSLVTSDDACPPEIWLTPKHAHHTI